MFHLVLETCAASGSVDVCQQAGAISFIALLLSNHGQTKSNTNTYRGFGHKTRLRVWVPRTVTSVI